MSGKKLAIQLIVALLCMTAKMTYAQGGGAWIGPIQHWCYGGTDTDFDGWDDSFLCICGGDGGESLCIIQTGCAGETCDVCLLNRAARTLSPVILKTGNYHFEQTDLVISGRGPDIVVHRAYNSHDMYQGATGWGWHCSLVIRVINEEKLD